MSSSNILLRWATMSLFAIYLTACGDIDHDLLPSDSDQRPNVVAGTIGHLPNQVSADFTINDSQNNLFTLSDYLEGGATPADAVVLYFTMWCPICLGHTDHMFNTIRPQFQTQRNVVFVLVDYISGSVALTRASEIANGYSDSGFITVADVDQALYKQYHAANGTTVVISGDGTILLNEDYRTGANLIKALNTLFP